MDPTIGGLITIAVTMLLIMIGSVLITRAASKIKDARWMVDQAIRVRQQLSGTSQLQVVTQDAGSRQWRGVVP